MTHRQRKRRQSDHRIAKIQTGRWVCPNGGDCCDLVEWLSNAIVEQRTRLFHAAPTRILSSLQHAHKCRVGSPKVACPSTHEQKMLLYRLASVFDQPITETQRLQSSERIAARIPETGLSVGKKLTAQQTRPQSVAVYTKSSSRGNRLSDTMNSNVSIVSARNFLFCVYSERIKSSDHLMALSHHFASHHKKLLFSISYTARRRLDPAVKRFYFSE
ncbi:hypothetical protein BLNAU_24743 [Blattamonas nauphoetae]|uniref:Uncharacterized protein n=1 Tax=Blattamonas nauphoetae TaxID=2049346 RepID=A0ABQ9WLK3_9EUKA|nr:hypothetical protein BLNAU_24743 [Blattamonas nauphoetae]